MKTHDVEKLWIKVLTWVAAALVFIAMLFFLHTAQAAQFNLSNVSGNDMVVMVYSGNSGAPSRHFVIRDGESKRYENVQVGNPESGGAFTVIISDLGTAYSESSVLYSNNNLDEVCVQFTAFSYERFVVPAGHATSLPSAGGGVGFDEYWRGEFLSEFLYSFVAGAAAAAPFFAWGVLRNMFNSAS